MAKKDQAPATPPAAAPTAPATAPTAAAPLTAEQQAAKDAKDKADAEAKAKAKADKEASRAKAKQDKADAKAKAKADKLAAKAAAKQPSQNDITRPKPGTVTGNVWQILDQISAKNGVPATIKEALETGKGIAEATVRTQFARWRKFHGISGRAAAPAAAETPAAPAQTPSA